MKKVLKSGLIDESVLVRTAYNQFDLIFSNLIGYIDKLCRVNRLDSSKKEDYKKKVKELYRYFIDELIRQFKREKDQVKKQVNSDLNLLKNDMKKELTTAPDFHNYSYSSNMTEHQEKYLNLK